MGHFRIGVPSLTFAETLNAVLHSGHTPVLYDVHKEDGCLKPKPGDKADDFLPVHYGGEKAEAEGSVYDSAHRIEKDDVKDKEGIYCYSFYVSKNITTFQGGMIATNDKEAFRWLRLFRCQRIDVGPGKRYQNEYHHYDLKVRGLNFKPDDIRAAVGIVQLERLTEISRKREKVVNLYNKAFGYRQRGIHLYRILSKIKGVFFAICIRIRSSVRSISNLFIFLISIPELRGLPIYQTVSSTDNTVSPYLFMQICRMKRSTLS